MQLYLGQTQALHSPHNDSFYFILQLLMLKVYRKQVV